MKTQYEKQLPRLYAIVIGGFALALVPFVIWIWREVIAPMIGG